MTSELHPHSSVYAFKPLFLYVFSRWIDFCLSRLIYFDSSINNTNQHYHASFGVVILLSNQIWAYSLVLHVQLYFLHLCVIFNVKFQLLVGKSNFSFVIEMNLILSSSLCICLTLKWSCWYVGIIYHSPSLGPISFPRLHFFLGSSPTLNPIYIIVNIFASILVIWQTTRITIIIVAQWKATNLNVIPIINFHCIVWMAFKFITNEY